MHGNHSPVRSEDPSIDGQRREAGFNGSFLQVPEMAGESAATRFRSIDTPDEDHLNLALSAEWVPQTRPIRHHADRSWAEGPEVQLPRLTPSHSTRPALVQIIERAMKLTHPLGGHGDPVLLHIDGGRHVSRVPRAYDCGGHLRVREDESESASMRSSGAPGIGLPRQPSPDVAALGREYIIVAARRHGQVNELFYTA